MRTAPLGSIATACPPPPDWVITILIVCEPINHNIKTGKKNKMLFLRYSLNRILSGKYLVLNVNLLHCKNILIIQIASNSLCGEGGGLSLLPPAATNNYKMCACQDLLRREEGRVVEHSLFSYFSDHCTYDLGKLNINLSNTMSDTLHPWEDAHDLVLEQGPELVLGEAGLDVELDVHVAVLLHLPGHRQHLVLHLNTRSLVYTPQNICYLPNLLRIIIRQQAIDVIHQLLQLQFWNEAISWKGKDKKYKKWKVSLSTIHTRWCRKCGRV